MTSALARLFSVGARPSAARHSARRETRIPEQGQMITWLRRFAASTALLALLIGLVAPIAAPAPAEAQWAVVDVIQEIQQWLWYAQQILKWIGAAQQMFDDDTGWNQRMYIMLDVAGLLGYGTSLAPYADLWQAVFPDTYGGWLQDGWYKDVAGWGRATNYAQLRLARAQQILRTVERVGYTNVTGSWPLQPMQVLNKWLSQLSGMTDSDAAELEVNNMYNSLQTQYQNQQFNTQMQAANLMVLKTAMEVADERDRLEADQRLYGQPWVTE